MTDNRNAGQPGGLGRQPTTRKLADYTLEEQNNPEVMTYAMLTRLRREAYREHVANMSDAVALAQWGNRMAEIYGPAVKAHHNAVTWPVALMIGRYGEEPSHWPETLTEADRERARQWEAKGAAEFSPGIRALGRTVTPIAGETLHGLDEFGDAITIAAPVAAGIAAPSSAEG